MAYYNLPQAPGQYEDAVLKGSNIYEEVEKERYASNPYICGVPLIPFAYLICIFMIVEGAVILTEDPQLGLAGFEKSETGYLHVVAWGDIVFAMIGALGVWFSHNLLPTGWRNISKMHSTIGMLGTGCLVIWRLLVCLSFAPWAGIMLAFAPANTDKLWAYALICGYMALSIFLVYVLALAFRQAVCDSKRFQQHLNMQALAERKRLLTKAHDVRQQGNMHHAEGDAMRLHEVEPELFGTLPLAETVTLYAAVIAIASLWNFVHLCLTGHSSGGWAFFEGAPQVSATFWIEAFVWPISFVCALIGFAGALSFCDAGFLDSKPSLASLLFFLIASMLRYAFLFAITGMDLIEKNTCGFYVNGLARLAYTGGGSGFLHCRGTEYLFLAGTLLCCILDGYLIWGTFQLWHHARDWQFVEVNEYASLKDESIRDL